MSEISICPDYTKLDIAMDQWSEPFWAAGTEGRTEMPRCTHCATFRWPASAFCPACHEQGIEWLGAGQARIYSFTILSVPGPDKDAPPRRRIPAVVEFDGAPGVRLVSVLIDAPVDEVAIGAAVEVAWMPAANGVVPVFRMAEGAAPL